MGHYLSHLIEPFLAANKSQIAKQNPQLRSTQGLGDWLDAQEPEQTRHLPELNYLVIDIETSGFNPTTNALLSIGFVPINHGRINLAKAQHYYISDALKVSANSAVINHIVPQMLTERKPLKEVLEIFFEELKICVPIAHGCWMEQQFLAHYTHQLWGLKKLPLKWLDTLKIEKARIENGCVPHNQDVRLSSIRRRYQLPDYQAHNALFDAIATAELFLVLTRSIYGDSQPTLQEFYRYQQKAKSNL
ncbi:MAG: DNA polymerase III PolC-type [Candidatus Celerinatantimonas neptuna]|nr:MAG: DNA polymerase III PolC-type [Candidatus Celerinatantimonas neptuna]